MKKILTSLAIFALALSANAAAVSWKIGSSIAKFDSISVAGNAIGAIVYLADKQLSSYTFDQIIALTPIQESPTRLGKINGIVESDSDKLGYYAAFLTYVSDGITYYNVSSTEYELTQAGCDDLLNNGTALSAYNPQFSNTVNLVGPGTIGGGWVPVPEPSVGLLALAGIGMLIRRKRA